MALDGLDDVLDGLRDGGDASYEFGMAKMSVQKREAVKSREKSDARNLSWNGNPGHSGQGSDHSCQSPGDSNQDSGGIWPAGNSVYKKLGLLEFSKCVGFFLVSCCEGELTQELKMSR